MDYCKCGTCGVCGDYAANPRTIELLDKLRCVEIVRDDFRTRWEAEIKARLAAERIARNWMETIESLRIALRREENEKPLDVRRMKAAIKYALDAFNSPVRTGRFSQGGEQTGNIEHCEAAMHGLSAALRDEPHPMILPEDPAHVMLRDRALEIITLKARIVILRDALVECRDTLRNEWEKHKRENGCAGVDGDCGVKAALDKAEAALVVDR